MNILNNQKKKIHDYVLMMLGAPVVTIELDDSEINLCIKIAEEFINQHVGNEEFEGWERAYPLAVKEGAVAYAEFMLSQMRSMFLHPPKMNEADLIANAHEKINDWKESVWGYYFVFRGKDE